MRGYVESFGSVPALILPCMIRYRAPDPMEGASVYPAVQNLLLAARALGYGGVITGFRYEISWAELPQLQTLPIFMMLSFDGTANPWQASGKSWPRAQTPA